MPSIVSVSSPSANKAYKAGDTILIEVTFDEAVVVDDTGGRPTLMLRSGLNRSADFSTVSDTKVIFNYLVAQGDVTADLDYSDTGALTLNGGIIKAASGGAPASVTLPTPGEAGSLGANNAIIIDTTFPDVGIESDKPTLRLGQTANITFRFSEDPGDTFMWNGSAGDVTVEGGTLGAISGSGATRTATFTPTPGVNSGTASITVAAGSYADAAGNGGRLGSMPSLTFDTLAPNAPTGLKVAAASDTGTSPTDGITKLRQPTITGDAESGSTVTLYDTDGAVIGAGTAVNGTWSMTPPAPLAEGQHTLTAKAVDAAGNQSAASGEYKMKVDITAPTVSISSNAANLKIGETATITFTFSEDPDGTFTWGGSSGDVVVSGGTLSAISGSGLVRTATFTPNGGSEGTASIEVTAASYTDTAGNSGGFGTTPVLGFDTKVPDAPAVALAAASDTGVLGDNRTTVTNPVIEGVGEALATITLYGRTNDFEDPTQIGTTTADANGKWSISPVLAVGTYQLSATQRDVAGNVSERGTPLALTIEATTPPVTTPPPTIIDGIPVQTSPTTLPGGVIGTSISIPIVSSDRPEVANIPLISSNGTTPLLAQVPAGVGLSGSGGTVSNAKLDFLISTIKAATPAGTDQGGLTSGGTTFINTLPVGDPLLVMTIAPVSLPSATGTLTLTGSGAPIDQGVALIIDSTGLGNKSGTIALRDIDFAAIIGATTIDLSGKGTILVGDGASQNVLVPGGSGSKVFTGGGADVMTFQSPLSTPSTSLVTTLAVTDTTTVLHGGQGSDVVTLGGNRADYTVAQHNGYLTVTSKADPSATTRVVNVEQLQFDDGAITVQHSASVDTLTGLYSMLLGRQADVDGISFWADARDAGTNWGSIAVSFINSIERQATGTGFNGNAEHDVTLLFNAMFHRAPDADGLAFWSTALKNGASLEQVASGFVASTEMVGHQLAATDWNFQV